MFLDRGPTVPLPPPRPMASPRLLPFVLPFFLSFPFLLLSLLLPFFFPSLFPFFLPSFLQSHINSTSPPRGGGDALQLLQSRKLYLALNPYCFCSTYNQVSFISVHTTLIVLVIKNHHTTTPQHHTTEGVLRSCNIYTQAHIECRINKHDSRNIRMKFTIWACWEKGKKHLRRA